MEQSVASACDAVPGLLNGALVMLPEGLLIAGVGEGGAFDREPLLRSAARCLARAPGGSPQAAAAFVECAFVSEGELVVMMLSRRYSSVALVVVCNREPNLALVLSSARQALRNIESSVDLTPWEV